MGHIDWVEIEHLPEAFKDGRRLLLWIPYDEPCAEGGSWDGECFRHDGEDGRWDIQPTHFAEINPPA